jgi:hypothetical protein
MKPLAIFFALTLFTTLSFGQDDLTHALSACGPREAHVEKPERILPTPAAPEPGRALVYVIEDDGFESHIIGAGVTLRVGVDGAWIGAVNHHSPYLSVALDPGEHHLCANWQSRLGYLSKAVSLAHLDAQADKLYYFRVREFQANGEIFLDLDPVDSDQGKFLIGSYASEMSAARKK